MAILVHGADFDRELLPALVALLQADPGGLALERADLGCVRVAAMGAGRTVRSEDPFKELVRGGFVVEVGLRQDGHDGPRLMPHF